MIRENTTLLVDAVGPEREALEEARLMVDEMYWDRLEAAERHLFRFLTTPEARAAYSELDRIRHERGAMMTGVTWNCALRRATMLQRVMLQSDAALAAAERG